ncbi:pyridoxal phosphate-dependent aminotransferase [Parasedimentitalea huanghaiensis]|uniref:histidinol-phosphate transaminase n=1 Tax=Parasedimentitalea huanghaiensis TaxID=2682100 RepID=A0A6L6WIN5_9RHOB|nr:histidinol-phosphate transaminase [Zongyanglinia huanghaiensis]MVO17350.1 aminotransferase class I/II-fold pyridoxal phosphate-dependent enzyme [Zongyanglinia huanghaiensis]
MKQPVALPIEKIRGITYPPPPSITEEATGVAADVLRLNLNESHLPPSPNALAAAAQALTQTNRYPDHGCSTLTAVISKRTGIPASRISFGNGSGEILVALAMLSINEGDEAVMPTPTFPTCGKGVQIAGGKVVSVPVLPDGSNDVITMLAAVTPDTRLFYLCNPNNPTGAILTASDLELAARQVPDTVLLVVDEAYFEFAQAEGGPDVLKILANRAGPWVVTRSFSKAYCMAGMRVGYALASDEGIHKALWQLRPNFNVNRVAIAAATAAMNDDRYLQACLTHTISERKRLETALTHLGFSALPSFANFLTVVPPISADIISSSLAVENILVQAMPWPGGNGALRITIGSQPNTDRLIRAINKFLKH